MVPNPLTYIVLYGWLPFVLFLFTRLSARTVLIVSFIAAYLFLPNAQFPIIPGMPAFTKVTITCYAVLLGIILFDSKRLSSLQVSWFDLPMLIWCLCPFASNLTNDLGPLEAVKGAVHQTIEWGLPYFFGRLYLTDLNSLRKFALGIFIGGLVYMPFCLWEVRMGPTLHATVYGFSTLTDWLQVIRYGGFRPLVFTPHGLALSIWMTSAALVSIWYWQTGSLQKFWKLPINWLSSLLLITVVLIKSTGAWFLLAFGVACLSAAKWLRTGILILVLTVAMSSYLYSSASGQFSGEQLVATVASVTNEERAASLEFRFMNEEILAKKARQKALFGWGWNGRNRVIDEWADDIAVTDSLWIIVFGTNGFVGLVSLWTAMLLPVNIFVYRFPAHTWANKRVAPVAALVIVLLLYMYDCLSNSFPNPVYTVAAGGLTGLISEQPVREDLRLISRVAPR